MCFFPTQNNPASDEGNGLARYLHNHQTGRSAPRGETPICMNAKAIIMSCNKSKSLVHPSNSFVHLLISVQFDINAGKLLILVATLDRQDLIIVRETTLIQGSRGDFVFTTRRHCSTKTFSKYYLHSWRNGLPRSSFMLS